MNRQQTEQQYSDRTMERKAVGARVVQLRESVNWSPADLCRHTGIDSGNLSKIERGQKGIGSYTLLQIELAVEAERDRRLRDGSFTDAKGRYYMNEYVANMCKELGAEGISQTKVDGVRESMSGIIKSVLAP